MKGGKDRESMHGETRSMIVRMVASLLFVAYLSALSAIAPAAADSYRWRWEKILGPGEHPWTTSWRSSQSGPFCDHAGEGKFCGCGGTSACGQYDNGQEITTAPYGCDRPERWRLRCKTQSE
jgi:hypothetical protein